MRYVLAFAILSWAVVFWVLGESGAMKKCQERHSFETCLYALHR